MGDPRKHTKIYTTPRHPWESARIADEKVLSRDFGLKNKKEIWKQASYVKKIKDHIKRLNRLVGPQVEKEKDELFNKLIKYNLLKEGQSLDEALELTTNDVMERRLQTQVVRQGLARSMKQARQFIVHGHINIDGKKITSPSYLISKEEQFKLQFQPNSALSDEEHPERNIPESKIEEKAPEISEEEKLEKELEAKVTEKIDAEAASVEKEGQADLNDKKEAAQKEVAEVKESSDEKPEAKK